MFYIATAAVSATQRQSCAPPAVNEESGNTVPEIDKSSPTRRLSPITSKLDESRSKLLAMLSQLDKYKCGKVGRVSFDSLAHISQGVLHCTYIKI